jgi:hypothetical protein
VRGLTRRKKKSRCGEPIFLKRYACGGPWLSMKSARKKEIEICKRNAREKKLVPMDQRRKGNTEN